MKNLIFSLIVIAALAVAGIGGTLADFSDSEEEIGDKLQAGSLDLKVNGLDDPNVLPFTVTGMIPDKSYHVEKTVSNVGTIDGFLYIHLKNVLCTETNDKDLNGDGQITAPGDNPEPENVAQLGGKVGQKMVPGLGVACDMEKHISLELLYDGTPIDLSAYDANHDGKIKLDEVECIQLLLGTLVKCGSTHVIRFGFILQDVPEEYYGIDLFNVSDPHEIKWEWWPTNRYQGDTVSFDILVELLQTDYTPPGGP